jgi:hypothetical protein
MQAYYRHHAYTASQQRERLNAIQASLIYPPPRQRKQ